MVQDKDRDLPRPQVSDAAHLIRRGMRLAVTGILVSVVALYCFSSVFALVWAFTSSFRQGREWLASPLAIPKHLYWENYVLAWNQAQLGGLFLNSIYVTTVSVVGAVFVSALAAYVISRIDFLGGWGNRIALYFALASLMVPSFLYLVPLYLFLRSLHLTNSHLGLILVYLEGSLAFNIFVLTGFFKTLPTEIEEAAAIDGSGPFRTFWQIMLPLASPGLITIAIFNTIGTWNEFFMALVLLRDRELATVPVGIWTLFGGFQPDKGVLFAALALVMIPSLVVFAVLQERITRGLTMGALKG